MYACIYVCAYVRTSVLVCTYWYVLVCVGMCWYVLVCMYVRKYVYLYVCTYVCMHSCNLHKVSMFEQTSLFPFTLRVLFVALFVRLRYHVCFRYIAAQMCEKKAQYAAKPICIRFQRLKTQPIPHYFADPFRRTFCSFAVSCLFSV